MKILLCTDGSRKGLRAIRLGGAIAAKLATEVKLLCVVEGKQRDPEASLQRASEMLNEYGITASVAGRRGRLVEEVLAELLDTHYDLVIVGYNERSFLEKAIWGSLAARIANELPASVLIVRGRRDQIKQVLIGISGRGFTNECAVLGGRIAAAFGARVTLFHASPAPPLMYAGLEEVVETITEFLEADTPEAGAIKRAVAVLSEMGIQAEVEVVHGLPEREVLRLAQEIDVDLVVVGSAWAAQPLHRLFARNVTEQVLINTKRPVLVVRPP